MSKSDKSTQQEPVDEALFDYLPELTRAHDSGQLDGWHSEFHAGNGDLSCCVVIHRKDWGHPFQHEAFYKDFIPADLPAMQFMAARWRLQQIAIKQAFALCFPPIPQLVVESTIRFSMPEEEAQPAQEIGMMTVAEANARLKGEQAPQGKGKEAVQKIMEQAGHPLKTAAEIPAIDSGNLKTTPGMTPPSTTEAPKRELTPAQIEANQWYLDIGKLSIEQPEEWDEHRSKLLTQIEDISLPVKNKMLAKMYEKGVGFGVGFNTETKRFFLMEIPQLTD